MGVTEPVFSRCATMAKLINVAKKHSLTSTRRVRLSAQPRGFPGLVVGPDSVEPNRCSIKTRFPCILPLSPPPLFPPTIFTIFLLHPSFLPLFFFASLSSFPLCSLPPFLYPVLHPACSRSLLPSSSYRESECLTLSRGGIEDEPSKSKHKREGKPKGLGLRGTKYH